MFIGILTLITALTISAVAIYYSVAGLVAIFAAAAVPIMIMGGALEVAKLVTAVWLHRYWRQATWWLKSYLTLAVIVLMFITSMGIFGFLSRAHIEQTATATEGLAQIERIETEIARQQAIIARSEERIETARNADNSRDIELQDQIDKEQDRIDSAYARIQPAIDEQLSIIESENNKTEQRLQPLQAEIDSITIILNDLQSAINNNEIEKAQGIVGTPVDGDYGPATARAVEEFRAAQIERRNSLVAQIDDIKIAPNDIVSQARSEIQRLRNLAEQQIADSNTLIERLRSQLGQGETADVDVLVDEQTDRINAANVLIDELTEQRYTLEAEYRKLEAEVGPVKYIAEFVYGETADKDLLEEAVRWVIVIIIFVFDPLAVLLLIASQYTFEIHRAEKKNRVQDNVIEKKEDEPDPKEELAKKEAELVAKFQEQQAEQSFEEEIQVEDTVEATLVTLEQAQEIAKTYDVPAPVEKKDTESLEESKRLTEEELDELDNDVHWQEAKRIWKEANPDQTLKEYKRLYLAGEIDHLPWEEYLVKSKKKILDETTGQPNISESQVVEGYIQNAEQNESSIWQRIKNEQTNRSNTA